MKRNVLLNEHYQEHYENRRLQIFPEKQIEIAVGHLTTIHAD